MNTILYRPVTDNDIVELAKIRAAEWETEEYWTWRITGYLKKELHPQQALLSRAMYVAVDDNKIVGFIAGHLTERLQCDGELQWINVIPEYRQKGVAGTLIKKLFDWFIEQKASRICVNGSGKLYENNGAVAFNEHWMIWEDIRRTA